MIMSRKIDEKTKKALSSLGIIESRETIVFSLEGIFEEKKKILYTLTK